MFSKFGGLRYRFANCGVQSKKVENHWFTVNPDFRAFNYYRYSLIDELADEDSVFAFLINLVRIIAVDRQILSAILIFGQRPVHPTSVPFLFSLADRVFGCVCVLLGVHLQGDNEKFSNDDQH